MILKKIETPDLLVDGKFYLILTREGLFVAEFFLAVDALIVDLPFGDEYALFAWDELREVWEICREEGKGK